MANTVSSPASLEETLNLYFGEKAPALPADIKQLLVRFAPWITLVLLLITLPLVLVALGLGALAAPLAFFASPALGVSYGVSYTLSMVIIGISLVLEALSIPGLFQRTRQGWRYAYWATLVNVVGSLIGLNIISAIVGALIGFYLLFQIRSYYGQPTASMST